MAEGPMAVNGTPVAGFEETSRVLNGIKAHPIADVPPKGTESIWNTVSRWLPSRNPDCDYWWHLSGPHVATMFTEAGYSIQETYEALVFYFHVIIPRLGPQPSPSGALKWKSLLTVDGTPIEYSWKWNIAGGAPDVRYTMEPIGSYPGTILDPLNQDSTKELLYQMSLKMPSLDLTWFHHLTSVFFDPEKERYVTENAGMLTSTLAVAFEFLKQGLSIKTYFGPKKIGQMQGPPPLQVWLDAVRGIAPKSETIAEVASFCKTDPEGSMLQPFMLAIDCVEPSKSRIKLYVQTRHTSFDSVRTIMTMGGKIKGVDNGLDELEELIKLVLGLDKDFPSSEELPATKDYAPSALDNFAVDQHLIEGHMYYFDIAPGSPLPDIKFYLPTRRYGKNDLDIARGLTQWLEARGRGQFTKNYMRVLDSLATHRSLEERVGLQTYISCCFQKGTLSMTTYLSPEAFDPQRLAKR